MLNISGYELLEKIGEGGMATVWKARQLSLDRIVAIKVLGKSSLPDQEARDRFRKEAQNAAKLNHPGIVQVYDTGEWDDCAYLVMEHVDGHTVGDMILHQAVIPEPQALEIVERVSRALAYAWEKECLIHCDIKPDNILIDRIGGAVKVADLGLARMIGMRLINPDDNLIIGTPNYTAPEQSAGLADLDCRTDMYSLGATLYHMVTGVLPFRGSVGSQAMNRHEFDYLEDPQIINPTLSAPTAWLIEKLMIKNRALRSHFWTQVLKDIEEVRRGHMPYPPWPEEGASTVRRSPTRTAAKSVRSTLPGTIKGNGEPKKLTIRKNDFPAPMVENKPARGWVGRFFQFLFSVVLAGAAIYAVLIYLGKVPRPAFFDFVAKPTVAEQPEAEAEVIYEAPPAPQPPPDAWRNEDFIQGARLFNQALADYKEYQQSRSNPDILRDIEENCREAIAYFEAAREDAPEHIPIGQYISQCNGLIFNVRQSTTLDPDELASPAQADPDISIKPTQPAPSKMDVTFIDDDPEPVAVAAPEPPSSLLRVSFTPEWDRPSLGDGAVSMELKRLLTRHAKAHRELTVDASVVLYPGITCMMTANEAARILKQALPIRRLLQTPGWPAQSLFYYQFAGEFSGAQQLTLVVDQNNRVVMVQLFDERPAPARMEPALFSTNWNVFDFILGRQRTGPDGLIAHRVRKFGSLIRIDTELAESASSPTGERMVAVRAQLMMPVQLAGMVLHIAQ